MISYMHRVVLLSDPLALIRMSDELMLNWFLKYIVPKVCLLLMTIFIINQFVLLLSRKTSCNLLKNFRGLEVLQGIFSGL